MDRVRRILSTTKAHNSSTATANANNNGPTIDTLAKSASNTFGIPDIVVKSGTPPPSPSAKVKTEKHTLDVCTLSALPRHMQQGSAPSTPGSTRYNRFAQHSRSISDLSQRIKDGVSFLRTTGKGVVLATISGFCLTLYSFLYQGIKTEINRGTVLGVRGIVQGFFTLYLAWHNGSKFKLHGMADSATTMDKVYKYMNLTWVAFLGGIRLTLIFAALLLAPMTIVHTMLSGTPVLVMILSAFMLENSDKCTLLKVFASCLFVAGVTLSNIKDFTNITPESTAQSIGYCFAAGALFFSAFGSVLTKKISNNFDKKVISSVIGFSILIIALCTPFIDDKLAQFMPMHTRGIEAATTDLGNDSVALPYLTPETNVTCFVDAALNRTMTSSSTTQMLDDGIFEAIAADCALPTLPFIPRDVNDAFIVLVIAVLGCGQQYCLIAALETEAPSKVTMVRSLSIIFTFMFEAVASAVDPTTKIPRIENWLGAAIVFTAIVIVASAELRDKMSSACKSLFCIRGSAEQEDEGAKEKSAAAAEGNTKDKEADARFRIGDEEGGGADDNGNSKEEKE